MFDPEMTLITLLTAHWQELFTWFTFLQGEGSPNIISHHPGRQRPLSLFVNPLLFILLKGFFPLSSLTFLSASTSKKKKKDS